MVELTFVCCMPAYCNTRMREGLHHCKSAICTCTHLCLKLALGEMLVSLSLKLQPAGFVHHYDAIGRQSHFAIVFLSRCAAEATQWRKNSAACRTQRDQPISERQHDTVVL